MKSEPATQRKPKGGLTKEQRVTYLGACDLASADRLYFRNGKESGYAVCEVHGIVRIEGNVGVMLE